MATTISKDYFWMYYLWAIAVKAGWASLVFGVIAMGNHDLSIGPAWITNVSLVLFIITGAVWLVVFGAAFDESLEVDGNDITAYRVARLVRRWKRLMKLPTKTFPLTEKEREAVRDTCESVLLTFAVASHEAIRLRDKAKAELDEKRTTGAMHPTALPAYRRKTNPFEKSFRVANKRADAAHRRYLSVWDFFRHDYPEGISVLENDSWRIGPSEFMESAPARVAKKLSGSGTEGPATALVVYP